MLLLATVSALISISGVQAAPSLRLSVGGPASVQDVDNFKVTATLTNTGNQTLKLYADPRSVVSTFPANSFAITGGDGSLVPFVGAKAKYRFKAAKNFVVLAPGESKTISHDLSSSYNFTRVGDYKVEAVNLFHYQDSSGNPVSITADIGTGHNARLSGNLVSTAISKRNMRNHKRATFKGCNFEQAITLTEALTHTTEYINNAVSYLDAHITGTPRYTTWFGVYTRPRKVAVIGIFRKLKTNNPSRYTYDCSCKLSDADAYVIQDIFGIIHICPSFWDSELFGEESMAGTILHESTHFYANGGTDDYAYGDDCKFLADRQPDLAIKNADNYQFFAENTPPLA